MRGALSVAEAAAALGTSQQTVRALLRKGDLRGEQRPWGSRYVWEVSAEGVDEFLAQYGRLDGGRRPRLAQAAKAGSETAPAEPDEVEHTDPGHVSQTLDEEYARESSDVRAFVLRPRGRATVAVVVLGVPLLVVYGAVRTAPDALWFREVGQPGVFRGLLEAKVEFRLLVVGVVALFLWVNLLLAWRRDERHAGSRDVVVLGVVALVVGQLFASAVANHWQTFLLWRHRQDFGVVDPAHGKDVGFFVFTLPLALMVVALLLCLVAVTLGGVALIHGIRGTIGIRPLHATYAAQRHLAVLAAIFLVLVAWRVHLQQYVFELQQPTRDGRRSFAGEGYVDAHVRVPALAMLGVVALLLAAACLATPYVVRLVGARRAKRLLAMPAGVLVACALVTVALVPRLVQHFVVDPNQLLSEKPFVERSIVATRSAMGLDRIEVDPYAGGGGIKAADFGLIDGRLRHVQTWDTNLLGDRMRQLVTDTPYYRPDAPTLDVVPVDGRRQPTVVSARQLDLSSSGAVAHTWGNSRLAYTHGLGLIRFSGTDVGPDREPRILDSGLGVRQPRIYFGDVPPPSARRGPDPTLDVFAPTTAPSLARSPWVLVDTRRPEVDISSAFGAPRAPYHYDGTAGIALSSWLRRVVFALALNSKQVLLSDDVTPESRLLLHRDIHDRLATLAPFLRWDDDAVPITVGGRILFVVDGYTTSTYYPYAEQSELGGTHTAYARASVRATIDAFSGHVDLYLTDSTDPLARAWADAFPSLFQDDDAMPAEVRARLRYPQELFDAQATAYQRFHTENPYVLASGSDDWTRPIALAGPLEVAGGVDFDESDEDDLRLTLQPTYAYGNPPGRAEPQLVITTLFVPRQGQNLVATLTGWVDDKGRPQLASRSLARDPVTLGPAQVSRLVFATPRVRDLLGLRNLEIRDLNTSSLDAVFLGMPHVLFLPGGVVQTQSLYEGSRGPGAARLLGVTVYANGRAGLGPNATSALRQALNEPPQVEVVRPLVPATVGQAVPLRFTAQNARREVVTITSGTHHTQRRLSLTSGTGTVRWVPTRSGRARVEVTVLGLDGTTTTDRTSFPVLDPAPVIKLLTRPHAGVVGEKVRFRFAVRHARRATVRVSSVEGIVFDRSYLLRDHVGVVTWTPKDAGTVEILVRAHGRQHQRATLTIPIRVRRHAPTDSPSISLLHVPKRLVVGTSATFTLNAGDCATAVAKIVDPDGGIHRWRLPCPSDKAAFTWTPELPGQHQLTVLAKADSGFNASQRVELTVRKPADESSSP